MSAEALAAQHATRGWAAARTPRQERGRRRFRRDASGAGQRTGQSQKRGPEPGSANTEFNARHRTSSWHPVRFEGVLVGIVIVGRRQGRRQSLTDPRDGCITVVAASVSGLRRDVLLPHLAAQSRQRYMQSQAGYPAGDQVRNCNAALSPLKYSKSTDAAGQTSLRPLEVAGVAGHRRDASCHRAI